MIDMPSLRRVLINVIPLVQIAVAATLAWLIAVHIGGHEDPFFAPIAVVVSLSSPLGERGSNAVRVLLGVIVGIAAGELTVLVLGNSYGRLAVATFTAIAVTRLFSRTRLVMVQAAAGAILTVAASDGEAGVNRLIDAGIGAAVVLVFSQILLSPEPVALIRDAAAEALSVMAEGLALTARAIEHGDAQFAEQALDRLHDLPSQLAELARLREASGRIARRSAIWHSRIGQAVRETENTGHIELLGASCIVLTRAATTADPVACAGLAPGVRRLADALTRIAEQLGNRAVRQAAADEALDVARNLSGAEIPPDRALAAVVLAAQMVAVDVMVVAGVDPEDAVASVRRDKAEFVVPTPPKTPRHPFGTPHRPHI